MIVTTMCELRTVMNSVGPHQLVFSKKFNIMIWDPVK
jgi:hypothetical protein